VLVLFEVIKKKQNKKKDVDRNLKLAILAVMNALIGYVRISKATEAGLSIESQTNQINAYAASKGIKISEILVDDGYSGKNLNRPQLVKALEIVKSGKASGIVVASISRLSRSVLDVENILENDLNGRQLIALDMNIDTATPSGRLIVNIMSGLYQFERSNLRQRTKNALTVKRNRGEALGRPDRVRYGFEKGANGLLVPSEKEQAIIELARQLKSQERSNSNVAAIINRRGYRNRAGGMFTSGTVSRMLTVAEL